MILYRVAFIILGPWLCVAIYDARKQNVENISLVSNFDIVNDCGDQYTQIATTQVLQELKDAQNYMKTIFIFQWIAMGIFLTEIATILIVILVILLMEVCDGHDCICDCLRPPRRLDDYHLIDRPPEEPYSFKTEFKTYLKSYAIFN